METLNLIASYGDLVSFKNYNDTWVVECAIKEEDGKIRITKLPDSEGQSAMKYQNKNKPLVDSRAHSILVEEDDIESIVPLIEAIKTERLFYNQHPNLSDRVCVLYMNEYSPQYRQAIEISKITQQTVVLQVCTNNDQRFYLPVVKEDTIWDVRVRYLIYKNYLPI